MGVNIYIYVYITIAIRKQIFNYLLQKDTDSKDSKRISMPADACEEKTNPF